jgi:uncharacterized protein YkwD
VAPAGGCTAGADWGHPRQEFARRVVALVNAHRLRLGLTRLMLSYRLRRSAVWKARHMARYHYLGHFDPAPPRARSPLERILACGYRTWASENIAVGPTSPRSVMERWLKSPGHRGNIERPRWRMIGVGVAEEDGLFFWVQNFGA